MAITATSAFWFIDNLMRVRVAGDETDGRLCLVDCLAPHGHMPPLHAHHREDEAFVVLDGAITLYVGGSVHRLGPGESALGPKGVPHTFRVETETARWLVACAPAGFERFVAAAGEPAAADTLPPGIVMPEPARFEELCREFGIELLGPPGTLPQ
ncbi:MAG TPA: cupin domain-containing protein [Gaiellaceae bacterium]|nr:cupin domain-containing protein [Gaiellaceae bacterium]